VRSSYGICPSMLDAGTPLYWDMTLNEWGKCLPMFRRFFVALIFKDVLPRQCVVAHLLVC